MAQKKVDCYYPGCKEHAYTGQHFNIDKDSTVTLPMCKYHILVTGNGQFSVKKVGKKGEVDFELKGPFKEVQMIEQVIGAREFVKKK